MRLRRIAEARLKAKGNKEWPETEADLRRVQHELEVHQVELELQNEELREARSEIEAGLLRYIELYDFAPVGYLSVSQAGEILLVNLAGASLFGRERNELLNRRLGAFLADSERSAFNDFLHRAFATRAPVSGELELTLENRPTLVVSVHAMRSSNGSNCRLVLTDITEHREAETLQRRAEAQYRSIFDNALEGLFQSTLEGRYIAVNPSFARILGYESPAQAMEHCPDIGGWFCKGSDGPGSLRDLLEQTPVVSGLEGLGRLQDGSAVWLSLSARLVHDRDGMAPHFEGSIEDITARRRGEADTLKLASFAKHSPNPIFELQADGAPSFFNEAARSVAEAQGLGHPQNLLPSETGTLVRECLRSGQSRELETVSRARTLAWTFRPVEHLATVHCYMSDRTELQRMEEGLRHSQKMEAIGQLAGGIAHDFNNILAVMMMQLELVETCEGMPGEAAESLRDLMTCAERAAGLTRQLLAFSRRQVMRLQALDLNATVVHLTKMLQRVLGEEISLQLDLETKPVFTLADPGMLDQVLLNLVLNARDAMPRGGMLTIETRGDVQRPGATALGPELPPGRYNSLRVNDPGAGIPPEALEHIFEPFFSTKEVGSSTGLGLATVFGIVKQHNGAIEVETEVGSGSTFTVYLPATAPPENVRIEEATPTPSKGNEWVLLAEDDASLRRATRLILEAHGYHVVEAGSGPEALAVWSQNQDVVQLLLTDIAMPGGMSGLDLFVRLQAQQPELKVIYVSGYSAELSRTSAKLDVGQTLLQKPYPAAKLLEAVRRCLDAPPGGFASGESPQ
jgi:PAS domain S-box-containing protein